MAADGSSIIFNERTVHKENTELESTTQNEETIEHQNKVCQEKEERASKSGMPRKENRVIKVGCL